MRATVPATSAAARLESSAAPASVDEPAYEFTNAQGERAGLLTDAFLEVLRQSRGVKISWGQLARLVRERILARCSLQRPELEGPSRRLLFQLEELIQEEALAYFPEHNRHWLRGGRLHGVHVGDEYAVMPLGALGPEEAKALARARVIETEADRCRVELEQAVGGVPPRGAPAFRIRRIQRRHAVELRGNWPPDAPPGLRLSEALEHSTFVRPARQAEPGVASVSWEGGNLEVRDEYGDRLIHPVPAVPANLGAVVSVAEVWARARVLLELESEPGTEWIAQSLEVEWGRVRSGRPMQLPALGSCLRAGDRLFLRLRNRGGSRLHVSVFDVGVSGAVTLLNTSQPSGWVMRPGAEELLGARHDGVWEGLELQWPSAVPRDGARPESLVFIASDGPVDLRMLETSSNRGAWSAPPPLKYAVKRIGFWLDPRPALR
jgi:hypothetical protein